MAYAMLMKYAHFESVLFVSHGSFEQFIWLNQMVSYGFPKIPIERWRDTMAKCYYYAIPASLGQAAKTLSLKTQKQESGKELIKLFSIPDPKTGEFREPEDYAEKFEQFGSYCDDDTGTTKELDGLLPDLPDSEQELWFVDQRINQQGLYVDLEACHKAVEFIEIEKTKLFQRFREVTKTDLKPTQGAKFQMWLAEQGCSVPNAQKATLEALVAAGVPDHVREAVAIKTDANRATLKKYPAFISRSRSDGLYREAFVYCGAKRTHRFASRGVQNLKRPDLYFPDGETNVSQIVDCLKQYDYETFESLLWGVSGALTSCIRGMIIPPPGHRLFVADFSQMENRVCAWLAGDENKLERFRQGVDPYKLSAHAIYNVPIDEVTKDQRFVGKVGELSLQYGGGINAYAKMGKGYGLDLSPIYPVIMQSATDYELDYTEFCYLMYLKQQEVMRRVKATKNKGHEAPVSREIAYAANIIKMRWRKAHPEIVQYWQDLENAACAAALSESGKPYEVGEGNNKITYFRHSIWLVCRLPGGICLYYLYPQVYEGARGKLTLSYYGDEGREFTYGGKLCENITQAVQRLLLTDAMVRVEPRYPVNMHVHDEIISPVKYGFGDINEFIEIMKKHKKWADGIPINAEGFICEDRYRK